VSGFSIEIAQWVTFGVCIFGFLGFAWQFANARGAKARGRRRTPEAGRRGDKRKLSRNATRQYLNAQKLLSEGSVIPASRILEQINMHRESIQILEDAGLIHEAAKILLRMRRSNRAGVVYARHAMWTDAARCFVTAGMPLEVAKCAREAGEFKLAGEYFEKANRPEAAAACFAQLGELQQAAKLYEQSGKSQQAMNMYVALTEKTDNLATLEFDNRELKMIIDYMTEGHNDKGLIDLVINRNKLTEVLINLIKKNMLDHAAELYTRSSNDIGPQLMAEIDYQSDDAKNLAIVFEKVSSFKYAGMIYERQNSFEDAGKAFEQAEDYQRAAYCYDRCGQEKLAIKFRGMANNSADGNVSPATPFALASEVPPPPAFSESDSTQIVETENTKDMVDSERPIAVLPANPPEPILENPITPPAPMPVNPDKPVGKFSLNSPQESKPKLFGEKVETKKSKADEQKISQAEPKQINAESPTKELPNIGEANSDDPISLNDNRSSFHKARFFSDLTFEQKNKIWNMGRTLEFKSEEIILTYNDDPLGIYVVVEGSVSVYRSANKSESYVDQMSPSDSFGELWLLADQPTEVKFVASKNTKVRIIDRSSFNELLDRDGAIARKLYRRFTNRLVKRLLKPVKKADPKAS
jgi:tetratricopeptide (TPR) repeat protein